MEDISWDESSGGVAIESEYFDKLNNDEAEFVGTRVPASDPRAYLAAFGMRASNVQDLWRHHYRFMDPGYTVSGVLQAMFDQNDHADDDLQRLGMDLPLPHTSSFKKLRKKWGATTTLREVLQRSGHGTGTRGLSAAETAKFGKTPFDHPDSMDKALARKVIGKGKPGAGRRGESRDFRPKGILKKIWDAFQNSKTGKKSEIAGDDILQYFT